MAGTGGRTSSLSRRTLITRGIAAGGLVWAAPAITSIGRASGQVAGTPKPCDCTFCATVVPPGGATLYFDCAGTSSDDCNCLCQCGGADTPCSHPEDPCVVSVTCKPRATPC